jgi:hypothetical protein
MFGLTFDDVMLVFESNSKFAGVIDEMQAVAKAASAKSRSL